MATPFLKLVSDHIFDAHKDNTEKLCIVLPNKRAGLFLKQHLSKTYGKTIWLPKIISAEEFFTELSQFNLLEEIDLICHLYESYKVCYGADAENFDSFTKWGQLILQDFNEIDRYQADPEQVYENLKDAKEIENWSLGAEDLSEYQRNYLKFMSSLGAIYKNFNSFLISKNWAYQGLMYKQALANVDRSEFPKQFDKILFCGFNALNAIELKIIQHFTREQKAELLWDADAYYLDDPSQEAGLFLRKNLELFPQSKTSFVGEHFKDEKTIHIISVPKQIGQAQVVKQKLQSLIDANVQLDKVALVLANEKLLWPVLQQLPEAVEHVNITMEYPIKYTSAYSLLDTLMQIQLGYQKQNRSQKSIYHKLFIQLFREPLFVHYLIANNITVDVHHLVQQVQTRNLTFITSSLLHELLGEQPPFLSRLLLVTKDIPDYCQSILHLLNSLIEHFSKHRSDHHRKLELEYLQIILNHYNRLVELIRQYPHFNSLSSYKQLFTQVIGSSSAPFIGEPLKGLQIMGILESRTLDFDHVIFVNVNEGILPSGKSINSFIPNDLKRAFGLPLYLEKDAIYAYHFYRLLQRAKDITITYDSETDAFGKGEKSRFVTQLQLELKNYNPKVIINEEIASYSDFSTETISEIIIPKSNEVLKKIFEKSVSQEKFGALSPSALIAFKECSLRFYFRYGAHLKEIQEVEESAEANTFGSILHLSLENLYRDLLNKTLNTENLQIKLKAIDQVVHQSFISFFDQKELQGKSILQEEVIKVYVKKLIQQDIEHVEKLRSQQHVLSLNYLEHEFSASLNVIIDHKPIQVVLKGKIDRVDRHDNQLRVIDYKTSIKNGDKFSFDGFLNLFTDSKYNKQFQLFMYAWLLYKNNVCAAESIQPCIIAFKDFKAEPKFIMEGKNQILRFTPQLLIEFEQELIAFIGSIFDTNTSFHQTEDEEHCVYCAYAPICNRQNNEK